MSGHIPPPGAADAVMVAAEAFLVAVQEATKNTHKGSLLKIALLAVIKVGRKFGVSYAEIALVIAEVDRLAAQAFHRDGRAPR